MISDFKGGGVMVIVSVKNCFIDFLPSIRALLKAKRFMPVVPLIGKLLRFLKGE